MLDNDYHDIFACNFSFWEHLTDNEKQLLCGNTVAVHYTKGKRIHNGGDDCIGLLLVQKGQLRTYLLSEEGREVTLYRLFPGDVCILSASCVLQAITFDVSIDAEEDTDVLLVNSSVFHQMADHNIYIECFGYRLAATRFSDVMWAMQQILFMGADKRLAIFLLDESDKSGSMQIHMTHEQIARYMGSAREVVSRMLKYFSEEGIVALSRGMIRIVDNDKLRQLV